MNSRCGNQMAVAGKTTRFNPAAPRRKASKRGASTMSRGRTHSAQPKTNEARTSLPERSEPRKANNSAGRSAEPGAVDEFDYLAYAEERLEMAFEP